MVVSGIGKKPYAAAICGYRLLLKKCGVQRKWSSVRTDAFQSPRLVEVDGRVVNDKPYTPEMYAVLDRASCLSAPRSLKEQT